MRGISSSKLKSQDDLSLASVDSAAKRIPSRICNNPNESKIRSWQVVDECFELDTKYKIINYLGAGAYGVVCAAYDNCEKRVVAIKVFE